MKIYKTTIQQRKKKVLIVFDDMTGDMEDNRNLSLIEDDEDNDELFLWYG